MARNDDGEFELIVGNRQLLTIVFIIFVLCGIVFTMGYFVGRNSGPPLSAAAVGRDTPVPAQHTSAAKPAAAAEPDPAANAQLEPGEAKVTSPQTAAPAPEPQQSRPTETATAPPQPSQTPAQPKAEPRQPEGGALREPVPGQTYVQVAAVTRPMAETLADVLLKKSFPSFVAPGPNDTIFRVLVGPVKDSAAAAKMKADLEAVGIRDTRVKKF